MKSGTKYRLLNVDGKGRIHIPMELRKETGIEDQVVAEKGKGALILKPVKNIENPVSFLSSLKVRTKKSPVEMKRESEKVFGE